jgi:hypothetical protein
MDRTGGGGPPSGHTEPGLDKRLVTAEQKPRPSRQRGGGKRNQRAKPARAAIDHVLGPAGRRGLTVAWNDRLSRPQYVGRGRGSVTRAQRCVNTSALTSPTGRRQPPTAFWLEGVFHQRAPGAALADAVLCYRNEYRIERIFHRLKSHIRPLSVNEVNRSLTYLLTLGIRVLTVMGCPAALSQHDQTSSRVYTGKPAKAY